MDRIWAPWRAQYILGVKPEKDAKEETPESCIFCVALNHGNDDEKLIVHRGSHNFIMMNLYPYTSGHLMVVPIRHLNLLENMTDEEMLEAMAMSRKIIRVFKKVLRPDGFNLGWNIGRVAGAGVVEHVHLHIVPRWNGDANFMPVLGDVKVISEHIESTFKKIRDGYAGLD